MPEFETVASLLSPDAPQLNKDLLARFHAALAQNPSADLLSMFTDNYRREHRLALSSKLSEAGQINLKLLDDLYDDFEYDESVDLSAAIPRNYTRRLGFATGPELDRKEEEREPSPPPNFCDRLDEAGTAAVVHPLSERVQQFLGSCASSGATDSDNTSLSNAVKHLVRGSPKLWELWIRGVVVKCSDDIVAKVTTGNKDHTEYTSMQYLAERVPDIPAPRPHGLIALGPFRVIFMTYIPGVTLGKAWPDLSPGQKSSVQQQLDNIFSRLRTLRMDPGRTLGGVCGEGAKELRVDEAFLIPDIKTPAQYSDWQFAARNHGSKTYGKFLRSFAEQKTALPNDESVFTHGDVRPDNIMVDVSSDTGEISITGIIDWEDSGFYPDYYECTAVTRTQSVVDEDDWFLYLPESISPLRYPQRWLADRLWRIHLRTT